MRHILPLDSGGSTRQSEEEEEKMSNIAKYAPTLWLDAWPTPHGAHGRMGPQMLEKTNEEGVEHNDPKPEGGFNPAIREALQCQLSADFHDSTLSRAAKMAVPGATIEAEERAFTIKDALRTGMYSL